MLWQPSANIADLKKRAEIFGKVRHFFYQRNIWEVETPLLGHRTVTDPFIDSIQCRYPQGQNWRKLYLQTSPEYAMKRLLAAGSGSIYQICKAFRQDECGKQHNPEFSLLEWYHIGYDHHQLMDEVDKLLQLILQSLPAQRFTYQQLFEDYLQCCPHMASAQQLQQLAIAHGLDDIPGIDPTDKDLWLQLLMTHVIEPQLGGNTPTFVYDYPASQAALAKIRHGNVAVAERFEVYYQGIELANGFHELTDWQQQQQRFEQDLAKRQALHYEMPEIDKKFLAALQQGLPSCAGVALGLDRLVMLAVKASSIAQVISFDFDKA